MEHLSLSWTNQKAGRLNCSNLEVKLDHTQFSYRKLLKIWSDPSRKLPVSLESDYSDSLLHYERLCLIVRSHEPILWESVPD